MAYAVTSGEVVLKGSEMMGMVMGGRAVRYVKATMLQEPELMNL